MITPLPDVSDPSLCGGRLTLTSDTPVTTTNVTAAGKLYFAPYLHAQVALYNGSCWRNYTFTECSLALTLTAANTYDVFLYDNAGTLTLETLIWTNATTRATALVRQDGVYCKTGALTRRYLGTLYASGTNTCEDSVAKRFLWNWSNPVAHRSLTFDTTNSWTDSGNGTWSAVNGGNASWKRELVIGVDERGPVSARVDLACSAPYTFAIALDSTSALDRTRSTIGTMGGSGIVGLSASFSAFTGIGYHYIQALESTFTASSGTAYGDNSASIGGGVQGINSAMTVEGWR